MSESLRHPRIPPEPGLADRADTVDPTPNDLLAAVARGDERAFELFYDGVAGMILGTVRAILREPAQAEDLTQEILLELWRTAGRYAPGQGDAVCWAMTLAHRRAVDRLRSAQPSTRRAATATVEAGRTPPSDQVADLVTGGEAAVQVGWGLAQLTESQRESVTLAYYRGLTYREIGDALHVSLATVKIGVRDGLIRLRDCLGVTVPSPRDAPSSRWDAGCS